MVLRRVGYRAEKEARLRRGVLVRILTSLGVVNIMGAMWRWWVDILMSVNT